MASGEGLEGSPAGVPPPNTFGSCDSAPGGLTTHLEAPACSAGAGLSGLSDSEITMVLAGQTARFAAAFLRWTDGRASNGPSYAQLRLLQALHCNGPAIMRDLGSELGASPRNMTAIVDALEQTRLVVRRQHPTDRRATIIELSPEGAREAEGSLGARLHAMSAIFAGLSLAEREHYSAAITKLMQAMQGDGQAC